MGLESASLFRACGRGQPVSGEPKWEKLKSSNFFKSMHNSSTPMKRGPRRNRDDTTGSQGRTCHRGKQPELFTSCPATRIWRGRA